MGIKTFRPLTPAARFKALPDFSEITKKKPEKKLTEPIKRTGGRNNQGRITMRHLADGMTPTHDNGASADPKHHR